MDDIIDAEVIEDHVADCLVAIDRARQRLGLSKAPGSVPERCSGRPGTIPPAPSGRAAEWLR